MLDMPVDGDGDDKLGLRLIDRANEIEEQEPNRKIDWALWLNKLVFCYVTLLWYTSLMSTRFWDRVNRSAECWFWEGSSNALGYGWFWWNGKNQRAHRVAWELTYGPIDDGLFVLHDCDTPECVNPAHLYLGTQADNIQDKVDRGRQARGVDINTAKLSEDDVLSIRNRYVSGESMTELCDVFGIGKAQVSKVIRGVDWKHVGGPVFDCAPRRDSVKVKRGEASHRSKLTKEDVLEIRRRFDRGEATMSDMSREYGVTIQAVSSVVHRRTWRHI